MATKIFSCSNSLYKTAQYLHTAYTSPPIYQPWLIQCKYCVKYCYPMLLMEWWQRIESLYMFSIEVILSFEYFPSTLGWIHGYRTHVYRSQLYTGIFLRPQSLNIYWKPSILAHSYVSLQFHNSTLREDSWLDGCISCLRHGTWKCLSWNLGGDVIEVTFCALLLFSFLNYFLEKSHLLKCTVQRENIYWGTRQP